jgi:hypothetical protein
LLAIALAGMARHAAAASAWDGLPASPVWGNVQYGMNYLQRNSDAMKAVDGSNAYWKLEGGMRLAKEWLAGIGFQEIAVSSDTCSLVEIQFFGCEDKSEKLTQWYATVVFNPRRGKWLYQAGLGRAKYSNTFDTTTFEREKHKGLGLHLGAGFDWTPQSIDDVHIGARLTYEYARLGQHSDGLGSYAHSRLSVGFSLSFY